MPKMIYFSVHTDADMTSPPVLLAQIDVDSMPEELQKLSEDEILQREVIDNEDVIQHVREDTGNPEPTIYAKPLTAHEFMAVVRDKGATETPRMCPMCLLESQKYDPPFDLVTLQPCDRHAKELENNDQTCIVFVDDHIEEAVPELKGGSYMKMGVPPSMIKSYVTLNVHIAHMLMVHGKHKEIKNNERVLMLAAPESGKPILKESHDAILEMCENREDFAEALINKCMSLMDVVDVARGGIRALHKLRAAAPPSDEEPARKIHPAKMSELN